MTSTALGAETKKEEKIPVSGCLPQGTLLLSWDQR